MIKFKNATISYGSSDYPMSEHLFPATLVDPVFDLPYIEEAVSRGRGNVHFELDYHFVPPFYQDGVEISPPYHIYMCDGIRVAYIEA